MKLFGPDDSMPERLEAFWRWLLSGHYRIRSKSGALVIMQPNLVQRRLQRLMMKLARQGRPVRVIILKARKEGVSTFIQALNVFLAQFTPLWRHRTIAHTEDSTADIHAIAQTICRNITHGPLPEAVGNPIRFAHESSMTTRTSGGQHVASGDTGSSLHLSELAKWQGTRQGVTAQLASVFGSLPEEAATIGIIECTANMYDPAGEEFKERWDAAAEPGHPYARFFASWLEDPSYRVPGAAVTELSPYEDWLVRRHGATPEQLEWRRRKLAGDFRGDEALFKQEYPTTPEEAFQRPLGRIYPMLAEDRHDWSVAPTALEPPWRIYRAIDFGGADPFVCLWVAHRPGPPRLTIDRRVCPNTWREHETYAYGATGRPLDRDDHTCDALRYAVNHWGLEGHVHVFLELYERDSAVRGRSLLDQALTITAMTGALPVVGTVCDRSQPGSIMLLNQQGLWCEAFRRAERSSERGEKADGIAVIQALLLATVPLRHPPPSPPLEERIIDRLERWPLRVGLSDTELTIRLRDYQEGLYGSAHPIYGGYC